MKLVLITGTHGDAMCREEADMGGVLVTCSLGGKVRGASVCTLLYSLGLS